MDATRWMPRIGAACAAVMLLVLAVPVDASAASSVRYDGNATPTRIIYTDSVGATDVVAVALDRDPGDNPAFAFIPTAPTTLAQDSGCETNSASILVCPLSAQRFVFELAGGNDVVDLTSPELTPANSRPSEVQGGPGNDALLGGLLADQFVAGPGDDTLFGLAGADRFLGGDGEDTLNLSAGGPWTVSVDGIANDGPTASPLADVGADVEVVIGGPLSDVLRGREGRQNLRGGDGADVLDGGPSGDGLDGGDGDDVILARDRSVDGISCGAGTDSVTADWNDVVVDRAECETLDRAARDDDGDGSPSGVDCNDGNAAIRPGAGDVPGNGVDEDCDGSDAVLDRDGDGAAAGVDCDDADAARRPGARDIPANGVDEDCSGKDAKRAVVAATFASAWSVFTDGTVITKLRVKGAPRGAKLRVSCKGQGCPFARKAVKLKKGAANLTKRFKDKRLRPGTVVELRVTAARRIGKVQRITIRDRRDPKRVTLCLPPGASKPKKCG